MDLFAATDSFKLNLKKPLAFFDLETTGVDIVKDRIVEISIVKINVDQSQEWYTKRINPTIPIPIEASQVHGIYDEDVVTAPTFKDLAKEIFDFINPCDLGGFNSNRFDIPVLLEEFIRAGIAFDIENRHMVDVHRLFTLMEKRDLTSAYKFYCGKDIENAHSAEADVAATRDVFFAQLQRYDALKNDVAFLHDLTNEERIIDSGRRLVYQNNQPCFNFGKHKGKTVEQVFREEPSYFSWMMNGDFPMHTKQKLKEFKDSMTKKSF